MKQNMLKPAIFFAIFFLITITTSGLESPSTAPNSLHSSEIEMQKINTGDSISIALHEVDDITEYVKLMTDLKGVQLTQNDKLLPCVQGLDYDLSEVRLALKNLKNLKEPYLISYEHSLKHMTSHTITLGQLCSSWLKNEDKVVISMLERKLDDLSYLINNVVYHVSEFLGDSKNPGTN